MSLFWEVAEIPRLRGITSGQFSPRRNTMEKTDFASHNLIAGQLNAILKKLGGEEGALKFLRGESQPFSAQEPVSDEPNPEYIIRVDRSVKPSYPYHSGLCVLKHPELEFSGPTEYDLSKVKLWLHNNQKSGYIQGKDIYETILCSGCLSLCLNLRLLGGIRG
jgi:hypothetical protein